MIIRRRSEQGATLIVVLMILLLIIIIGTLAVRQSLVSLNIATAGQAQQLMTQSSDAAVFTVQDAKNLSKEMAGNGLFGYLNTSANKGKELVFCYKGQNKPDDFFQLQNASLIQWESGTTPQNSFIGMQGYCNPTTTTDFNSGRNAVMTQISVQFLNASDDAIPFSGMVQGTDTDSAKVLAAQRVIVYSTSLMPTLSSKKSSDIYTCLSSHMSNPATSIGYTAAPTSTAAKSVSACLTDLNVPFITHVSEYSLVQSPTSN